MIETQDRKRVTEAVVTATLCAVATGLVGIGMELLKRHMFFRPEQPKEPQPTPKQ